MEGKLHLIDPDGDVLLVVDDCSDDDETETKEPETQDSTSSLTGSNTQASGEASPGSSSKAIQTELTDSEPASSAVDIMLSDNATTLDDAILRIGGTKMRVSSKHLILASKYFRTNLTSSWQEGQQLKSKGFVVMRVTCSNLQALLILLNIIHCRNREVPRSVDLELLCEIAVLVDYYGFHEATEAFSEIWINKIECLIPETAAHDDTHIRKLTEYIWISIVFNDSALFKKVTSKSIHLSRDLMPCFGLPIPAELMVRIDNYRQINIYQVLQSIRREVEWLLEGTGYCDKCTTWNLGEMLRLMHSLKFYPFPEKPYTGFSFADLRKKIIEFKVPKCHARFHTYREAYPGDLISNTQSLLSGLDDGITGLDLETYKSLAASSLP